jgi:hypothetical protein
MVALVTAVSGLLATAPVQAQCAPAWIPGIGAGAATGAGVYDLLVLPNGLVLVSGEFTQIAGNSVRNLTSVNPATNTWSAVGLGTNARVYNAELTSTTSIIYGGAFSSIGGNLALGTPVDAQNVARLNLATGEQARCSLVGTDGDTWANATLPNGNSVFGGSFATVNGGALAVGNIVRYDQVANTFSAIGAGVNGTVFALLTLPGGDLIVAGSFSSAGGVAGRNNIARVNPLTSSWTSIGSGTNGTISSLALLPNGEVAVGGIFTIANGVPGRNNIARFNPTTGVWGGFGSGTNGQVNALTVTSAGDLLVGGSFTSAGGVAGRNNIAQVVPSTEAWSGIGTGTNGRVRTIAMVSAIDALVGGDFSLAGGQTANRIARLTVGAAAPTINT